MKEGFDPTGWSKTELKQLADWLYAHLGLDKDVDLEQELIRHYHRCNEAADHASTALAAGTASAGAAAVLTATTGALRELARLQTDLYNAERVKVLERCMMDALQVADNRDQVLEEFTRLVEQADDNSN